MSKPAESQNTAIQMRHARQQMVVLHPHTANGAETEIGIEKDLALELENAKVPAALLLVYGPDKNTFTAASLNGYLEHMASQAWPSASAFAHTLAEDLYDHGLPHSLTVHLDVEHDGLIESFEVKREQPKRITED